ncbi:hypothetical protein HY383_03265 [Candidatus Daviesbacteria bacterium]|nr:hypothetical protein [Candidatus Daviesbacteria bacterium]
MKVDFEYFRNTPPGIAKVALDGYSIKPAREAVKSAQKVGLGIRVFSYSDLYADHAKVSPGEDFINYCALVTSTAREEQLKSMFAADAPLSGQSMPNAVVAVVKYSDRIDLVKLAGELQKISPRDRLVGTLKFMSVEKQGVPRGYLGINPECLMVPTLFTPPATESWDPYTDNMPSNRILDESLRGLSRFCMLVGYRKADALVVVEGQDEPLGDKVDIFFRSYFDSNFAIADIAERGK